MNETQWLAGVDPTPMFKSVSAMTSARKVRLFLCACWRRDPNLLPSHRALGVMEAAEGFADGQVSRSDLMDMLGGQWKAAVGVAGASKQQAIHALPARRILYILYPWGDLRHFLPSEPDIHPRVHLLRDIVGNPFHPVSIHPAWLTPTVTSLATAAYEERSLPSGELDTARLAILADALEDAGCDNADIIAHLRAPGLHVRGCWVVDLLLGKE
jgi:hypothetical protein